MKLDLSGIKQFFSNLGNTINALAASRKAIVIAVGQATAIGVILAPQFAPYADKIVAVVGLGAAGLALTIAIEDFAKHLRAGQVVDTNEIKAAADEVAKDLSAVSGEVG